MTTTEELREMAEFDHPFEVGEDQSLTYRPDVRVPYVYNSPIADVTVEAGWDALVGMTNQHGYNGAVMHASEYISRDVAERVLTSPGVYVVVAVLDEEDNSEIVGWSILRRTA